MFVNFYSSNVHWIYWPAANFVLASQILLCLFPVGTLLIILQAEFMQGILSIAERPKFVIPWQWESCKGKPHFLQADKPSASTPSSINLRPHLQSFSRRGESITLIEKKNLVLRFLYAKTLILVKIIFFPCCILSFFSLRILHCMHISFDI